MTHVFRTNGCACELCFFFAAKCLVSIAKIFTNQKVICGGNKKQFYQRLGVDSYIQPVEFFQHYSLHLYLQEAMVVPQVAPFYFCRHSGSRIELEA